MFIAVILIVSLVILRLARPRRNTDHVMKTVRRGFLAVNGLVVVLSISLAVLFWMGTPIPAFAEPLVQTGGTTGSNAMAAAVAVGLATIGAGIAVAFSGSAAISALAEKPEVFGRTLIFVGLAEGIAIYGILIAFMILTS